MIIHPIHDGISVHSLSKSFQARLVLEKVNFETNNGGKTVIIGPSGAGKSTLLRIIAGLELPDEGEVYLDGQLATTSRWSLEPCKRNIGFVFQNPTLWPHMTIRENILFGLSSLPRSQAEDQVNDLLKKAQISQIADKYPDQTSGGEAKRAALVRSIAPRPRYLLVDEPFANLDEATKQILLDFMMDMVTELQITLLYVTHNDMEVERVGGNVLRILPNSSVAIT